MYDVMKRKAAALYRLVWLSRPLHQQVELAVESMLAATPITVRMRAVLEALREEGASSVPEVARVLQIKRQYVQLMMNEVVEAGYVERQENPGHKRSPKFVLTKSGDDLIFQVRANEQETLHSMASQFTEAEIATALKVTEAVLARFTSMNLEGQS